MNLDIGIKILEKMVGCVMSLKFKNRSNETNLKKVMVYGADGSGKSTFAEQYCNDNNLNPICIDIDDTNYTNVPILELDFGSDIKTYNNIKSAIQEISKSDYDTIILDGVTSLLEMLVSKAKGLKKYADRAERFQDILRLLLNSKKHLIFIGQKDMEVIYNDEFQSNKMVIKINSIVNEKYLTYKKKEGYSFKTLKYRSIESTKGSKTEKVKSKKVEESSDKDDSEVVAAEQGFTTADKLEEDDSKPVIKNYVKSIAKQVIIGGHKPIQHLMTLKAKGCVKRGEIAEEYLEDILAFIDANCPEKIDEKEEEYNDC